jgi:hypothetical protein
VEWKRVFRWPAARWAVGRWDEEQARDAPATGEEEILDFGFWMLDGL